MIPSRRKRRLRRLRPRPQRLTDPVSRWTRLAILPHPPRHRQAAIAPALLDCLGGSASKEISYTPAIHLAGHFNGTITKYKILGTCIPTGATLDMAFAATVSGRATVTTSGDVSCNASPNPILVPIPGPAPISFYFDPSLKLTIGGSVEVSNVGLDVTAGVQFKGHFGLTNGADFSGSPIFSAVPSTPKVVKNGSIGVKVGGQIIIGPGAGSPNAGVIAGVGGELNPLDDKLRVRLPEERSQVQRLPESICRVHSQPLRRRKGLGGKLGHLEVGHLRRPQGLDQLPGLSFWYHPDWLQGCRIAG